MSDKSVRKQFTESMLHIGKEDPNLVVLVGDISHFALQPFAKECPGRYYNIGICEPTILSMAAGLSKLNFHVVVHTIAPFIMERSLEQIKLDFCYQQISGNLITVGSAFDYSNLGCTHHCYNDFALLRPLPNTEIIYPASPEEFDILFRQTYQNDKLTLFRLPEAKHEVKIAQKDIQIGKGIKISEGENLTIVATGPHLKTALEASKSLKNDGWDAEVIYIHTIKPLDNDLILDSVKKTRNVCVIEEHMESGGLSDAVVRLIQPVNDCGFMSLSIPDEFVRGYGSYEHHLETLGLTAANLAQRVKNEFTK